MMRLKLRFVEVRSSMMSKCGGEGDLAWMELPDLQHGEALKR